MYGAAFGQQFVHQQFIGNAVGNKAHCHNAKFPEFLARDLFFIESLGASKCEVRSYYYSDKDKGHRKCTCPWIDDIGVLDLPDPRFGSVNVPDSGFLSPQLCLRVEEADVIGILGTSRHCLCINLHAMACSDHCCIRF